jgi:hypothetical protein
MSYTVGFGQSSAERLKQLQLLSHYATDPSIRLQATTVMSQIKKPTFVIPNKERPFPAYSFETTDFNMKNKTLTNRTICV